MPRFGLLGLRLRTELGLVWFALSVRVRRSSLPACMACRLVSLASSRAFASAFFASAASSSICCCCCSRRATLASASTIPRDPTETQLRSESSSLGLPTPGLTPNSDPNPGPHLPSPQSQSLTRTLTGRACGRQVALCSAVPLGQSPPVLLAAPPAFGPFMRVAVRARRTLRTQRNLRPRCVFGPRLELFRAGFGPLQGGCFWGQTKSPR